MKEIKAYIRRSTVSEVATRLEEAGAPRISIVEIHPVGYGYEPNYFETHFENVVKRYAHLRVVKLEVGCADRDPDRLVGVVQKTCHMGAPGDAIIFVTDVVQTVRLAIGTALLKQNLEREKCPH